MPVGPGQASSQAMRTYHVYIMASRSRVLYVGVTNDLSRRIAEHKDALVPGFTSKYRITRLVHVEVFAEVRDAIAREKAIKGWKRSRKISLIQSQNPTWVDLAIAPTSSHFLLLKERAAMSS
jgi:putative endonuclease